MNGIPLHRRRARVRKCIDAVAVTLIAVLALFPILWGISTSLKPPNRILAFPPELIPSDPTLMHYQRLVDSGIWRNILNSVVISAGSVILCVALGVLGGYALARFKFSGKALVMMIVVVVMSIPLPSLMVPTYSLMSQLGLTDSRFGLMLLYSAYQLPITVWILYGFFQTLPRELEDAAMVDGYGRLQVLLKVVLPLSGNGLVASALFVLTFAWNDFVVALVMNSASDVRTLPVAIYDFMGYFGREWGPLTAASMVSIVPVVAIFVVFQRYFLSGVTGGGVKG